MLNQEYHNEIKKIPLFQGLSESRWQDFFQRGMIQHVSRNTVLFQEKEEGSSIYILLSGAIKLYKNSTDGKEVMIKLLRPGELFAEAILFGREGYPVTAQSVTESTLYQLDRKLILDFFSEKEFREAFCSSIMKRLRYLTNRLFYLSAYDVEERFFHFIRQRFGVHEYYEIDISKKEMASAIGTIPETLSRLLNRLGNRNILRWQDSELWIDPDYWRNFPEEETN